ncbi:MAG: hypothetical protein NVS3B23_08790 [Candidatus Saccharimonadales bacterium]
MQLSKSEYMMFLKQPAWLWLKKHDKQKLPPVDENTQAMFDAGNLFEAYAEKHFPDGIRLGFDNYDSYLTLPDRTREAIVAGTKTIFQGRFEAGRLTFICDVLTFHEDKSVDLYEIKSSTKVKPEHIYDLAFQVIVLEDCGYKVNSVAVIHVNNSYARKGAIDPLKLTEISDVTEDVMNKREITRKHAAQALTIVDNKNCPSLSPSLARLSSFKDWFEIYKSIQPLPDDSVFNLCSPSPEVIGRLESAQITTLQDIPDDFTLTDKQRLQVQAVKTNAPLIQKPKITAFLKKLEFPLYFFDYETLAGVVPEFDGLKPYQQLPFQYSLHYLETPDGTLQQKEYLHRTNDNPVPAILQALQKDLGPTGTILVWYDVFEKTCNTLLGQLSPEHAELMKNINDRIVDLMTPFSNGWYVDKDFCGSASIKKVLPVLVPELSHGDLAIHEGQAAQRLWMQAVLEGNTSIDKEQLFSDLVEYCGLDTFAMVKIWEFLTQL